MEEKLKNIFCAVLMVAPEEVDDNSSPDTISAWDSLAHMNLVVAIEEEFNVKLRDQDVVEMLNFEVIKVILSDLLNEGA